MALRLVLTKARLLEQGRTHMSQCFASIKIRKTTIAIDDLLSAPQVRKRYGGISDMCLWRWLRDQKLGFPQPLIIRKRRYWRTKKLEAWERAQAGNGA
jgi:predicted DNA-binding transcriptional regulator AlpA